MNPEVKKQWVDALRSGDYKQGRETLRTEDNGFCCLGVLTDLAVKAGVVEWTFPRGGSYGVVDNDGRVLNNGTLPLEVQVWADVYSHNPEVQAILSSCEDNVCDHAHHTLSGVNDDGVDFNTIADLIEGQL